MNSDSERYVLKLFITGRTERSENAITTLRQICRDTLNNRYELLIIDVLEHPNLAEEDRILATPTVIKELPPPMRTIIGDLTEKERVLVGLNLNPDESNGETA